ncbi:MAG: glycosylhydrolase-like jelly roll fold domain-containing protein, partial [Limisphaerales bacterium]
ADIYFVASRWAHPEKVDCAFRISGKQPELWNPVTGEIRDAIAFIQNDDRTFVPLKFDPCGSIFVVFNKSIPKDVSGKTASNYPVVQQTNTLSGSWTVNFDPKWGGPAKVIFDQLIDWTNSSNPGIKYYSGAAIYHKKFDLPTSIQPGRRVLLDLGEVHEIAVVHLNGRDLGVLWTKPARVDITSAVKPKDNDLEIKIVNLWPNRLIRDESLPKGQRLTETNIHKFAPTSPLLPSGLIGPVNVLEVSIP